MLKRCWLLVILAFISFPLESFSNTEGIANFLHELVFQEFKDCELVLVHDSFHQSHLDFERMSAYSGGMQQVRTEGNITFARHKDVHRYTKFHCSLAILTLKNFNLEMEAWLLEAIIPKYGPLVRKDQDHFVFISSSESLSDRILMSNKFGKKIKYKLAVEVIGKGIVCKTGDLFGNDGVRILKIFDVQDHFETSHLFPDMTKHLNGKVFRFSVPKVAFRFEMEKRDGRYHPKRGFYKWWLDEAMNKFNFSYHMFPASFGGGTGKRLKNGTWVGAVGDVLYDRADISIVVGEIYSRFQFISWSAAISYEWIVFLTHPPRKWYSATAIFKPFTPLVWALFCGSIGLMTLSLKNVIQFGFRIGCEHEKWNYLRIFSYVISTFLEQDKVGPFKAMSVRCLCSFWLLFAMVTATAYRGKLVSLIAFPVNTFVPTTFEELANSHFKVALNVVGKAGAAYDLFSSSTSPVIQKLFGRMETIPEAGVCLQRTIDEDLACIIWQSLGEYTMHKNLTDRNGNVPLQESTQIAIFIHDGLVYERRAIFGEHWDRTINAAGMMGLTKKWIKLDQQFIKRERKIWEERHNVTEKVYDDDKGPKKLIVPQFVGLFLLYGVAVLLSLGVFSVECFSFLKKGNPITSLSLYHLKDTQSISTDFPLRSIKIKLDQNKSDVGEK